MDKKDDNEDIEFLNKQKQEGKFISPKPISGKRQPCDLVEKPVVNKVSESKVKTDMNQEEVKIVGNERRKRSEVKHQEPKPKIKDSDTRHNVKKPEAKIQPKPEAKINPKYNYAKNVPKQQDEKLLSKRSDGKTAPRSQNQKGVSNQPKPLIKRPESKSISKKEEAKKHNIKYYETSKNVGKPQEKKPLVDNKPILAEYSSVPNLKPKVIVPKTTPHINQPKAITIDNNKLPGAKNESKPNSLLKKSYEETKKKPAAKLDHKQGMKSKGNKPIKPELKQSNKDDIPLEFKGKTDNYHKNDIEENKSDLMELSEEELGDEDKFEFNELQKEEKKESKLIENKGFGLEYFFRENSVTPEVQNLIAGFTEYADELVAAEHNKEPKRLANIPERSPGQEISVSPGELNKKASEPQPEFQMKIKQSLNPLLNYKKRIEKLALTCDPSNITNAIVLPDIKSLCRSLSYALRQHIIFSRGKKLLSELGNNSNFSFKLGNMLEIPLKVKAPQFEIDPNRAKNILSESIAVMTGTHIRPELLNSYLTIEDNEDEDLSYTKSQLGEVFGPNKGPDAFMKSYQNSIGFFKSSIQARDDLMKTQNIGKEAIQAWTKIVEEGEEPSHSRKSSDDFIREESESIDLDKIDISKNYKKTDKQIKGFNVEEDKYEKESDSKDNEINDYQEEDLLSEFAVFNLNYDFGTMDFTNISEIPPEYLEVPSERVIYKFCKKVLVYGKMEKEISILGLIYIEKLILKTGFLMNELNWRRVTFTAFILASKVILIKP